MKDIDKDTGETVAIHSGGIIGVDRDEPSSCSSPSAGSALLAEAFHTLKHDRIFITSREKMNKTGVELHDELVRKIADHLNAPNK